VSEFKTWSIGLAALGWVACASAQAQQPLKFNYGAPTGDYYVLYTARDAGLFEKNGLEPNFFLFPSGAPLLAGLKSESLDVITTGLADYGIDNGVCPVMTGGRTKFLQQHPDIGLKLVQIHHQALELIEKNPQLAIDAMAKYLSVTPSVAKATYDRLCCARKPTAAQQLDPNSPYSLVSKDGGVNKKFQIATQMLADAGSIREPLTAAEISEAIDYSYLRRFVDSQK
jgi:ABC-type nitrate/sulfonate/bicarbonate transport system substrate-binding protein